MADDRIRANIAIAVASLAAVFTGWQAYEARQARLDAQKASGQQTKDIERSRKAAEASATAAQRGGDAAWNTVAQLEALVATGRAQIGSLKHMFEIEHTPYVGYDSMSFDSFKDKPPRMDTSKPTEVSVALVNSGRPAFGCQVKVSGKFDRPTKTLEYSEASRYPAIFDLGSGGKFRTNLLVPAPASLSPACGDLRLYLYWRVDCAETLTTGKKYEGSSCGFFPVSKTGEILDSFHGCSDGDPSRVLR
jgi:hypothetical protein